MSVATHDPSRVVEVMQLREAKIRLLSMERIELMSRPLTPPLDDCEENPFEEAKTEEPLRPFSRSLKTARPKSSNAHLPSRSTLEFDKALRSTNCSSRMFIKQFQIQRSQRARKNAKAVFDALQKSISAGESVNISVHDYISTIIRPVPGRPSSGAREGWALHKSSSTGQAKKGKRSRSGMVIYVDPSIDTTDIQCVLHVEYGPQFSQKQSITVSNDGSYCGLELTGASWNLNTKTPTIAPLSVKQDVDLNRLAISFDIEAQDRSLPGWCGTLPIFIPVDRCRCRLEVKKNQKVFDLSQSPLRFYYGSKAVGPAFPLRAMPGLPERPRTAPLTPIRTDTRKVSEDALEKLSVFCFAASSVEAAIRIVNDCVGPKLRRDVANDDAGGGSSSLHVASLHGNIEVNINYICSLIFKYTSMNYFLTCWM